MLGAHGFRIRLWRVLLMEATSSRWSQVTPSQHAWEATALEKLRNLLPDTDPYRVWTNFEFTNGGQIYEVDALVVTAKGVYLVEVKSWAGKVTGDQGTWVQQRRDGTRVPFSSPARINTGKVRSLASLIRRNWQPGPPGSNVPYIGSLVWFSDPNVELALPAELASQVAKSDDNTATRHTQTLSEAILEIGAAEAARSNFERVTAAQSDALAATVDRIGFKESRRTRTTGSYELELPAFAERGSTQDFLARHKVNGVVARVRIYSNVVGASPEEAKALKDAANREFLATRNLGIDGVVQAVDLDLTEFGPAVIFRHRPKSVRLDQFLAEGNELDIDARLNIVETLATTLGQMHRRRVSHRMLTPESVWLSPGHPDADGRPRWEAQVSDFSLATREGPGSGTTVGTYTRVGTLPVLRSGAVEVVLGDPAMETYLAPESFTDPKADGVSLDVYSLGALTYLLCTDRAPAADRAELRSALAAGGLSISAVVPEIDPRLDALVRQCTNPIVSERTPDMASVLDAMTLVRGEGSGDRSGEAVDPLVAGEGDLLEDRFEVKRRLGKGSTAVALWCRDRVHDRDVVLKVALGGDSDGRLSREADAIRDLRFQYVVELFEELAIGGRPTLVLSFAGERSMAGYLRAEGSVSTEFLRRWGEDLLEAVRFLERNGVAHRDVKPDNLGIIQVGPSKEPHLVLFDFSLNGVPADDLLAGTPPYLDPFLSDAGRGSFDLAAERYAAAVTIHEMATGETPVWGDGQSDPAYLGPEVSATVLAEAIDPEVRAPVVDFLTKALNRDPAARFDTADDMARAWLAVFADWEVPNDVGVIGEDEDDEAGAQNLPFSIRLPDNLTLDDPVSALPVSRKVRSALGKVGALTVRQVADLDAMEVNRTRGVATKTRKAVLRLRAAILERFADDLAPYAPVSTAKQLPASAVDSTGRTDVGNTEVGEAADAGEVAPGDRPVVAVQAAVRPDIDQLGLRLVPPRGKRGRTGAVSETVELLLGLTEADVTEDWLTISATARQVGLTPGAVSNALQKGRAHWATFPEFDGVAEDLLTIVADLGGVAGVSELIEPLVDLRGSGNDPERARRLARGVVRAVLEADAPSARWFSLRRFGLRTIVAVNGPTIADSLASASGRGDEEAPFGLLDPAAVHQLAGWDPTALIDLAVALGQRADELVGTDAVVPSGDAVAALRAVRPGVNQALSAGRLVRLAAASSDHAAANAASDLVPIAATAADALRWSRTALVGSRKLTPADIGTRVLARFPMAVLPDRPLLDDALVEAGLPFVWSDIERSYVSTAAEPGGVVALTVATARRGTVFSAGGTTFIPPAPTDPQIVRALKIDERLERSIAEGGFLALRVPVAKLDSARRGLARFGTGSPAMTSIDLEATFLGHLRTIAADRPKPILWPTLEGADERDGPHWERLANLAGQAVEATILDVAAQSHVTAWFPGALVRHAPPTPPAPLDRLVDLVLSGRHSLRTLWLVVLGSTVEALPKVDGTAVPILAAGQWMDLSEAWLNNAHRAGGLTA